MNIKNKRPQNHKIDDFIQAKTTNFVVLKLTSITLVLFFSLLISCNVNPDNTQDPYASSSSLLFYLNGEDISSSLIQNVLYINLDNESTTPSSSSHLSPHGFLEIKLQHKDKSGNDILVDTTFISPDVPLIKRSKDSVAINLNTATLPIGLYRIECQSSLGSSFSSAFDFNIYSSVNGIKADYSIQDPIPGVNYQNDGEPSAEKSSSPIMGENGIIYLATNSVYTFNLSATNNVSVGAIEYLSYGTDDNGRPLLRWNGSNNITKTLTTHSKKTSDELVDKYKDDGSTDGLPYFEIKLKGTPHIIKRYVILRQYINAEITETDAQNDTTRYISLTKEGGVKFYNISLLGTTANGSLQFSLPEGVQNNTPSPPTIPTEDWRTTSTNYGTFTTKENKTDIYFEIYFNGLTKTFKITPHLDTIYNNKNIDFFLHVKDSEGNYLGYWKILIGGVVEKISIKSSELKGSPGQSGTITATVYPTSASASVLWYVSDTPYSSESLQSPTPSEDNTTKNIISMLPYPSYKQSPKDGKLYTIAMKNRDSSSDTKYYNAMTANPGIKNGVSTLVYTLGTIPLKAYLTAVVCKIDNLGNVDAVDNYSIYASIPITVSASGEIAIRSLVGVINTTTDNNTLKKYRLDPYTNEKNQTLQLPNRETGQYYPSTAEDGIYGVSTRSFYFPHNASGEVLIDLYGIDKTELSLSPTSEADKLFTITQNNTQTGVSITITPLWYQYWKDYNVGSSMSKAPPAKKGEYIEGYGYFTDYIGIGNIYFTINGTNGILRIVIYDNNKYENNLITS